VNRFSDNLIYLFQLDAMNFVFTLLHFYLLPYFLKFFYVVISVFILVSTRISNRNDENNRR